MEKDLPFNINKLIRTYKPIEYNGLTIYPVKVREYEEFQIALPAIEVMQQAFPVRYMSMPLLQAYFQMDFVERQNTGLLGCAMLMLALVFRLGEGKDITSRMLMFQPVIKDNRLQSLRAVKENKEVIEITPICFQKLRPLIAAQNGVRLQSDDANPDLVKADRDIAELNSPKLNANIEQMIASVCTLSHSDEEEVEEWTILKLNKRAESLQRALDYLVCGIGGSFGGFGDGGNPVPHPFYEKTQKYTGGLVAAEGFMGGAASKAIQNEGQQTIL